MRTALTTLATCEASVKSLSTSCDPGGATGEPLHHDATSTAPGTLHFALWQVCYLRLRSLRNIGAHAFEDRGDHQERVRLPGRPASPAGRRVRRRARSGLVVDENRLRDTGPPGEGLGDGRCCEDLLRRAHLHIASSVRGRTPGSSSARKVGLGPRTATAKDDRARDLLARASRTTSRSPSPPALPNSRRSATSVAG